LGKVTYAPPDAVIQLRDVIIDSGGQKFPVL
jgi:hypothetical protein